jgi:hypothetical protein
MTYPSTHAPTLSLRLTPIHHETSFPDYHRDKFTSKSETRTSNKNTIDVTIRKYIRSADLLHPTDMGFAKWVLLTGV